MLKFLVFDSNGPAKAWPLRNAYLIGVDGNAVRADIRFEEGAIICEKSESGTAALVLQHPVGDLGELTVQTCQLPERRDPYLLQLELARHRLMVLYNKLEEWAMFELGPEHPAAKRLELSRKLFIEALCHQRENPAHACEVALDCLVAAIDGSEELALAHSALLLNRRKRAGLIPKHPIGMGIRLEQDHDRLRAALQANFDYLQVPAAWKALAPEEGDYRWAHLDSWANWATRTRTPLVVGPVISFEPAELPDWLYIWEHDYDTVRDLIYEHIEAVVTRYRHSVTTWKVVSGLHVNSHFTFNFEQLMDLTRMATMLVKKIQPAAKVMIEIRQPFGEYYAKNHRSVPPMLYADLVVQSAIPFDVFGLRLLMGQPVSGQRTRDLMCLSKLLDEFAPFGKPVYVTAGVPSGPVTDLMISSEDRDSDPGDAHSGRWRRDWSPVVQSHWLQAALQVALSKPFIDGVAWSDLIDHESMELPLAGLIGEDLQPKPSFRRLALFRRHILTEGEPAVPDDSTPAAAAQKVEAGGAARTRDPDDAQAVGSAPARPDAPASIANGPDEEPPTPDA